MTQKKQSPLNNPTRRALYVGSLLLEIAAPSELALGLAPANPLLPVKFGLSTVASSIEKVGLPCASVVLIVDVVTVEQRNCVRQLRV